MVAVVPREMPPLHLHADLQVVTALDVTHRSLEGLRRQMVVVVVEPRGPVRETGRDIRAAHLEDRNPRDVLRRLGDCVGAGPWRDPRFEQQAVRGRIGPGDGAELRRPLDDLRGLWRLEENLLQPVRIVLALVRVPARDLLLRSRRPCQADVVVRGPGTRKGLARQIRRSNKRGRIDRIVLPGHVVLVREVARRVVEPQRVLLDRPADGAVDVIQRLQRVSSLAHPSP